MKKSKLNLPLTRRQVLKAGLVAGAGMMLPMRFLSPEAFAAVAPAGLSDPASQPKFRVEVPDALSPGFIYQPVNGVNQYRVGVGYNPSHDAGLQMGGEPVMTPIFGYGDVTDGVYTWPGRTFQVRKNKPTIVQWNNNLAGEPFLITSLAGESVVDTTLHWAYSLHGYDDLTIDVHGVPIVVHLHGGHSKDRFDGNPEQFFTPNWDILGPRFGGRKYVYKNDQPAGNLWYHDHCLGITRLNVYAGMAGFYFLRDRHDTGKPDNPLGLPAQPYEKAYAIQDRMFKANGELFYPAFPGDPWYDEFIEPGQLTGNPNFPYPLPDGGGPTALAEFFGDHMVVNGIIWPKELVQPRQYRLHLLNGTDSRFMAVRFRVVGNESIQPTEIPDDAPILPFTIIGSDQGLAASPTRINRNGYLLSEPGSRYDIIINFRGLKGQRIIMENLAGDEPFGGDLQDPLEPRHFECTDRIMAFDVTEDLDRDGYVNPFRDLPRGKFGPHVGRPRRIRKVALFEGMDEFGRLQPLLGTAEPATDLRGRPINWPAEPAYSDVGLVGQMEGAIPWHSPTTENPKLNSTEEWEIWNATGDAHPVHLHLVHFEVIGRQKIKWDSHTTDDDRVIPNATYSRPKGNGTWLETQPVVQHNGDVGSGFRFVNLTYGRTVRQPKGYVENTPKDMVTALPDQITRIKAKFDKPGRYVWHCHILSHEDHEMMRVLHVGGGA